jgi:rod shape determining protein RodA
LASIAQIVGARSRVRENAEYDPIMLMLVGVLTFFGLVTIWSAAGAGPLTLGSQVVRQGMYVLVGLTAMVVLMNINYRFLKSLAIVIYVAAVALLASLPIIGTTILGATRWIYFGPISIQPSEIAKLAVIIALAAFLSERHDEMHKLHNFIFSGLIVLLPFGLVFLQPDLGTSLVFASIWFTMLVLSPTRRIYLAGMVLLAIPTAFIGWKFLLRDYQRDRLLVSYDPQRDYFGEGFNIIQAHVTIGTGGWFGHGLTGGLQSEYQFLRVRETDFIFAHAMSMFGFVGGLALFLVFVMLYFRVIRVIGVARDSFGQYLAVGVIAMFIFQTFVNIGMNLGLMPVTGIPLPFISLGGTSLIMNLAAIGILQSIVLNRTSLAFQPRSPSLRRA